MKLLELHILQSFPTTCLNRDDLGSPKSMTFGGVRRARVSSQCWKRAIRLLASENSDHFGGQRGLWMSIPLAKALVKHGMEEQKSSEKAIEILDIIAGKDKKHPGRTTVGLYLSPGEIDAIASAAAQDVQESGEAKPKKGALKKAINNASPKDIADISLFGRMVASDHTLSIEAAAMVSHAITTHSVSNDLDFFAAVDETKADEEDAGSGHIGTLEFNSGCYYRTINVNLDLLFDDAHLGHLSDKEKKAVLKSFIESTIMAVPSARKNSMFGHNPPGYVMAVVREGQPLSLANAFEKPIKSKDGFMESSIEALRVHQKSLAATYGIQGVQFEIPENSLPELIEGILANV